MEPERKHLGRISTDGGMIVVADRFRAQFDLDSDRTPPGELQDSDSHFKLIKLDGKIGLLAALFRGDGSYDVWGLYRDGYLIALSVDLEYRHDEETADSKGGRG